MTARQNVTERIQLLVTIYKFHVAGDVVGFFL